jgi:hypothetical protein
MKVNCSIVKFILCAGAVVALCASFTVASFANDGGAFAAADSKPIIGQEEPNAATAYAWYGTAEVFHPLFAEPLVIPGKGRVDAHSRTEARQLAAHEMYKQASEMGKVLNVLVDLTGSN